MLIPSACTTCSPPCVSSRAAPPRPVLCAGYSSDRFVSAPHLLHPDVLLQAMCTWIAADGMEECRRTCGGHGFSRLSGLPTLIQGYVQVGGVSGTWLTFGPLSCKQCFRSQIAWT